MIGKGPVILGTQVALLLILLCAKSDGFLSNRRRRQLHSCHDGSSKSLMLQPFGLPVPYHSGQCLHSRRCLRLHHQPPKQSSEPNHIAKSMASSTMEIASDARIDDNAARTRVDNASHALDEGTELHPTISASAMSGRHEAAPSKGLPDVVTTNMEAEPLPETISTASLEQSPQVKIPLEMPWSASQVHALRDKVSRYTVQIPVSKSNHASDTGVEADHRQCFILWRNLVYDTPELAGYPIPFLVQRLQELSVDEQILQHVDHERSLPFLDAYEFEATGGISANVYGVLGVADGTRIRTSPVGNVHVTLPHNFVQTMDQSVTYELGRPLLTESEQREARLSTEENDVYSLNGISKRWQRDGKEVAAAMLASTTDARRLKQQQDSMFDSDLLQLGGLTALVIGGALAMESLSHHLTVNVFWV